MTPQPCKLLGSALLMCLLATQGQAHTRWNPEGVLQPRSNGDDIKTGPCGNLPRSDSPAVFTAGETITVEFESTIYHQGHFRIAFSPGNDQGFDDHVLVDNIPDYPSQRYRSYDLTLPDTPCTDCTLQLIQVMLDRNPPTNYFSCADIQLEAPSSPTPPALTQFSAAELAGAVQLEWNDLEGNTSVVVVENTQRQQPQVQDGQLLQAGDTLGDGQVVYVGNQSGVTLQDRQAGSRYHYFAYVYDEQLRYSPATEVSITLEESQSSQAGGVFSPWALIVILAFLRTQPRRRKHGPRRRTVHPS